MYLDYLGRIITVKNKNLIVLFSLKRNDFFMRAKILIVEDENDIGSFMVRTLNRKALTQSGQKREKKR